MPYDALGNYIPGDDEPSLDQMRLALTRTPQQSQQQQRPLDSVTDTFKRLATEFNPLMMGRTLQDAPKILYNAAVAPVASTWAGALKNIQAAGASKAYSALGMPQEAAEAESRVQPVTPQGLQAPLRSVAGQQTQEALGEAFNALHLPPMGPGSGMPGTAPLSPRPLLTPNDVRVMGARATHAVREAGQIPTDIANVRNAGIQRLSLLTGAPSVGSRIGSAIEGTAQTAGRIGDVARDVGQSTADYMQMRREMGLSPVPGLPPEFFPDLNLYAMRPKDSTLVTPSVPSTKNITTLDIGTAPHGVIESTGANKSELRASELSPYLLNMDLDVPRTDNAVLAPITQARQAAFTKFVRNKAREIYPDAPTDRDAVEAFNERFSRPVDLEMSRIQLYDQFRESPEGQAVDMGNLPSSTELQGRHAAASQWLNSTLLNYVKRKFGAEGDPLVQQAAQGITMLPAEDIRRMAENVNEDVLKRRRAQAGMPVAGTLAPAIRDKSVELSAANDVVAQLQQRREEYRNIAMQQGLPDPAQLPEYAATTNPLNAAVAKRDKLQEELSNLQLGRDYEKLSDVAVAVDTQPALLGKIEYPQQQFYPSVTRARPDETLFHISRNSTLESTGFNELAAQFYDDVMRGNIPIDKLKGLTVEKYVRNKAEGRVAEEKRQAQATAELKNNIEARMRQDMAQYVKPENYFGNVGVLELSTSTGFTPEQIRQLISDDTLVLDHCVADSGVMPGSKAKNLWNGKDRRYMPLVDPVTGQLLPNASRTGTRYIDSASEPDPNNADMLASVRDKDTGLPVATIEFQRSGNGKYRIGYASGYQNGAVKKEYHEAIKDYLNSRAEMIGGSGSNLEHAGIIDTHSSDGVAAARRELSVSSREAAAMLNAADDAGQLPRFVSYDDLRNILKKPEAQQSTPTAQQPAAQQGMTATDMYNFLRDAARTMGVDESAAVSHVLHQVRQSFDGAPAYSELLREQPTAFAERIAELAAEQGNAIVEQSLLELADRIAPRVPPARPLNPPEAWPLIGQQLAEQGQGAENLLVPAEQLATSQGRGAGAPLVPSTRLAIDDAFELAERGLQGEPSAIELLNNLENDIRGTYLQPNATINDLRSMRIRLENTYDRFSDINRPQFQAAANALYNDLLPAINAILEPPQQPANQPPAVALGPFEEFDIARDLLEDARLNNQAFNVEDLHTTLFALENGNFDDARFRELGPNSAAAQREVAAALRQTMADAGIPLPEAQQAAQLPVIAEIRNADRTDLINFIEPDRWPLLNERVDQAAQGVYPADAATIAEAIRNGQMTDITNGLNIVERELVARDAQQLVEVNARRQGAAAEQPANQFDRVPFDDAIGNLHNTLIELAGEEGNWRNSIAEVDRMLDDLAHGADSIYGLWEGDEPLTNREREYLAEQLRALRQEYEIYAADAAREEGLGDWEPDPNHPANRPVNQAMPRERPATAPWAPIDRDAANMSYAQLQEALTPAQISMVDAIYDDLVRANTTADDLDTVAHLVFNYPMSLWEGLSIIPRALLYKELTIAAERLREREGRQPPPEQGFQEGGLVKYPNFIDAQNVAIQRSQQMNPRVDETDTEADAARHMLASGYMAKSFNPTIAKGLGWLHEAKEAPFRTIGHALGLSNPRYDYEMDMHNNALGIELAKKAKDRADFERMVQESLKQSTTTTTPGRPRVMTQKQAIEGTAALKYTNGGTVSQPQSLDAMKYELMMRSK